jgi:hypothetical protein
LLRKSQSFGRSLPRRATAPEALKKTTGADLKVRAPKLPAEMLTS